MLLAGGDSVKIGSPRTDDEDVTDQSDTEDESKTESILDSPNELTEDDEDTDLEAILDEIRDKEENKERVADDLMDSDDDEELEEEPERLIPTSDDESDVEEGDNRRLPRIYEDVPLEKGVRRSSRNISDRRVESDRVAEKRSPTGSNKYPQPKKRVDRFSRNASNRAYAEPERMVRIPSRNYSRMSKDPKSGKFPRNSVNKYPVSRRGVDKLSKNSSNRYNNTESLLVRNQSGLNTDVDLPDDRQGYHDVSTSRSPCCSCIQEPLTDQTCPAAQTWCCPCVPPKVPDCNNHCAKMTGFLRDL